MFYFPFEKQNIKFARNNLGFVFLSGVMDKEAGPPHSHSGDFDVHLGPKVPGDEGGQIGQLDPANKIPPNAGLGGLRVSGQYGTEDVVTVQAERCR